MLQTKTVSRQLLECLNKLMSIDELSSFRLVGGTALALRIGHKNSIGIDLFSFNFEHPDPMIYTEMFDKFEIWNQRNRIGTYSCDDIKVDIVNYPYPWLENQIEFSNVRMASLKDIAAMKIAAITNRGTNKDFIDLYYLLEYFSFNEILQFYEQKFKDGNIWLALRSLSFFDDAEAKPLPIIFGEFDWEKAKRRIREEVKTIVYNFYLISSATS